MTADRVEEAIEVLARKDAELGRWTQAAADALTAGEGVELISQSSVQRFLWYYLPKKWDEPSWEPMLEGAAALLDELGLERYARIARSEETGEVLSAWRAGRGQGFTRFKAATDASGVEPLDTDLLTWGDVMGMYEEAASTHVERALERAVLGGRLSPGTKGWRRRAGAVCEEALGEEAPPVPTQSWLTLVVTERVESWVRGGRPEQLLDWRQRIANRLLSPPEPPRDRWGSSFARASSISPRRCVSRRRRGSRSERRSTRG